MQSTKQKKNSHNFESPQIIMKHFIEFHNILRGY